jgi:hypothetical protein
VSRALFGSAAGAWLLLAVAACPAPPPPHPTPAPTASAQASAPPTAESRAAIVHPLHRPIDQYDFVGHVDLLDRILENPFQYFRFTSRGFAARICELFSNVLPSLPTVNLHGDAHLEQFAVTSSGYGLVDFDDATAGPAVIDLVRFGVSLRLAARARGWDPEQAIDHLFAGYRTALHHPKASIPLPDFVDRARAGFSDDRLAFLDRSEKLMSPLHPKERPQVLAGWARYVQLMTSENPSLNASFFELKHFGNLRGGVGSALDRRILARVEGPTEAPEDDVILEAKELRDMSDVTCVRAEPIGGRFRTIVGRARLGDGKDPYLALIPRGSDQAPDDAPFWIQSWLPDYRELDAHRDLKNEDELEQIAFAVGMQLGRGHVVQIATPFDEQLRRAELDMLREHETRIRKAIAQMTEETLASWRAFQKDAVPLRSRLRE